MENSISEAKLIYNIKDKLVKAGKISNDTQLIIDYFKDKYDEELNEKALFSHQEEILEFVDEYCESDYPIQYLVGFEYFLGQKILINENTLIPRMETEEVVDNLVKRIKVKYPLGSELKIVDVCTGSGAIIVGLNYLLQDSYKIQYYATDISAAALEMAKQNFKNHQISVKVYETDLIEALIENKLKFDILISNPPYITYDEEIDENVKKYEPHLALYADDEGLYFYKKIIKNMEKILENESLVCFEIGMKQGNRLKCFIKQLNLSVKIDIIKDISERDRILILEK